MPGAVCRDRRETGDRVVQPGVHVLEICAEHVPVRVDAEDPVGVVAVPVVGVRRPVGHQRDERCDAAGPGGVGCTEAIPAEPGLDRERGEVELGRVAERDIVGAGAEVESPVRVADGPGEGRGGGQRAVGHGDGHVVRAGGGVADGTRDVARGAVDREAAGEPGGREGQGVAVDVGRADREVDGGALGAALIAGARDRRRVVDRCDRDRDGGGVRVDGAVVGREREAVGAVVVRRPGCR